ncbi:MAG TPA: FAD-dependent monooxygenase, partial [Microbacterium sp.]|nr:FAD-dependent monooxygenase [Microbacterium sp.]
LERLGNSVEVRYGAEARGFIQDSERVRVRLADETEIGADVLIGADGIHSAVRSALFRDRSATLRQLGYHTCAYTIRDETLHRRLADRFTMTDTVERTVGLYGTSDGRVAVWGVHRVADPTLPGDPREELQERYRGLGPDVDAALALCPPSSEVYYDQVAQVVLPEWSRGRVALVGDACGAVSLLAGQGASLAVAGGAELARRLAATADVASGIAEYERLMRPVVQEKQGAGQRAAASFVPRSAFGLWFRRMSLRMLSVPVLDRIVARGIVGKSSEVFRA